MTGQDFQNALEAIVVDLQTKGKGQTVQIAFRSEFNTTVTLPLSSDANGTVNASELANVQGALTAMKFTADAYEIEREPVTFAFEEFKTAQLPHEALMTAATQARKNLSDALEADANYQAKKTALETARENVNYVDALANYRRNNVSENYGNLGDAKGKYVQS